MADNLDIKGIADEEQPRGEKFRTKGKRKKPYGIETRTLHDRPRKYSIFRTLKLHLWYGFSRYETRDRRDQALAALVKKDKNGHMRQRFGIRQEFRKVDPDEGAEPGGGTGPF